MSQKKNAQIKQQPQTEKESQIADGAHVCDRESALGNRGVQFL